MLGSTGRVQGYRNQLLIYFVRKFPSGLVVMSDRSRYEGERPTRRQRCGLRLRMWMDGLAERLGAQCGGVDILVNAAAFCAFAWIEEIDYGKEDCGHDTLEINSSN